MDMHIENSTSTAPVKPVQSTCNTDGQSQNPYVPPRKRGKDSTFGAMLNTEINEITKGAPSQK